MARTDSNWIQTFTGRQAWPTDPRPEDFVIEDIAHALAMKCRYTGHTLRFYSVAQHSVIVSNLVPPEDAMWGLMHDAAEAYLADLARPIKRELPEFVAMENRITESIAEAFGLKLPIPDSVHTADMQALATERMEQMARPPRPWISTERITPVKDRAQFASLNWEEAEWLFLERFRELEQAPSQEAGQ